MLEQALQVVVRSLISLTVLFFVTKLIGRKQVSELSLFDYTIGISIGNFAAESTMNFDIPFIHGIVAVTTYGIVAYLVSIVTMKSIYLRRFFNWCSYSSNRRWKNIRTQYEETSHRY